MSFKPLHTHETFATVVRSNQSWNNAFLSPWTVVVGAALQWSLAVCTTKHLVRLQAADPAKQAEQQAEQTIFL